MDTDYGPNRVAVTAFIERCRKLTPTELDRLSAVWTTGPMVVWGKASAAARARKAANSAVTPWVIRPAAVGAWDAASEAAWSAARESEWGQTVAEMWADVRSATAEAVSLGSSTMPRAQRGIAWEPASYTALALAVRDLITETQFATLTNAWRGAGLPVPDDSRNARLPSPEVGEVTDYGSEGLMVLAFIERCATLTLADLDRLTAAWDKAKASSRGATRLGAQATAQRAGWWPRWEEARAATAMAALNGGRIRMRDAPLLAASDAALALVVRDRVPTKTFEILTRPWRDAGLWLPTSTR